MHGVRIEPGGSAVIAGGEPRGEATPAQRMQYSGTGGLASDRRGNLLLADGPQGVHRIDARGIVEGVVRWGGDAETCCAVAAGVAAGPGDHVYVLDAPTGTMGPRVWFVNAGSLPAFVHGRQVRPGAGIPVAGTADRPANVEEVREEIAGPATQVPLIRPTAIAVDRVGNLYITDRDSPKVSAESEVLRVDRAGQISRIAGAGGGRSFNGDGLPGRLTALGLDDIYIDRCGNLLLADAGNRRIRRLNLDQKCFSGDSRPKRASPGRDIGATAAQSRQWLPWALGTLGILLAAAGGLVAARSGARGNRRDPPAPTPRSRDKERYRASDVSQEK